MPSNCQCPLPVLSPTIHLYDKEQTLSQKESREKAMSTGTGCCNTCSRHVIIMRSTLIASIYFAPVLEELCHSQPLDEISQLCEQLSEVRRRSTCYAWLRLEGSAQEVICPMLFG